MKKVITMFVALIIFTSSFGAVYAVNNDGTSSTDIEVNGVFQAGKEAGVKISVDVSWDEMSFTYVDGDKGEWQPDKHSYAEDAVGAWENETKTITVTNHSNAAVTATLSFATSVNGLVGSFNENSGTVNDGILMLSRADEGASLGELNNAPTAFAEFGVSGKKITGNTRLGVITVSIAADGTYIPDPTPDPEPDVGGNQPGTVTVSDATTLLSAVDVGGDITLSSDISDASVNITKDVSIDLAGSSLSNVSGVSVSSGKLTLKDSVGGGAVSASTYAITVSEGAELVVIGSVAFNHSGSLSAIQWYGGIIDLSAATGESYTITVYEGGSASAQNLILPAGYAMYDSSGNLLGAIPQTYSRITIKPIV